MSARRLTVAQALVEFLAHQWTVDGDLRERTIRGILGIFGHGNVAGLGQALKQYNVQAPTLLPYHQARNEQAMVHQAVGFARIHRRRATLAATASVGPGAACGAPTVMTCSGFRCAGRPRRARVPWAGAPVGARRRPTR